LQNICTVPIQQQLASSQIQKNEQSMLQEPSRSEFCKYFLRLNGSRLVGIATRLWNEHTEEIFFGILPKFLAM